MSENLVIVESPAKSKTIEKYLGQNYRNFYCWSFEKFAIKEGIDVKNNIK